MAVRRTAAFCDPFRRSTVRLATAPSAMMIAESRSLVRLFSSFDSASAIGRTTTSPSDTHMYFTRPNCASSMLARCVTMCRSIEPATSASMALMAACRLASWPCGPAARTRTASSSSAASKSPTSSRSSSSRTTGVMRPFQRSGSSSMRSKSSSSVRSSTRSAVVATVLIHAVRRSGGSSFTCSTWIACVRARDSSRPYASDTYGSSE